MRNCTSAYGYTAMLNTLPYLANQVSVHPPLSQMRIGATELTTRSSEESLDMTAILSLVRAKQSRQRYNAMTLCRPSERRIRPARLWWDSLRRCELRSGNRSSDRADEPIGRTVHAGLAPVVRTRPALRS